MEEITFLLMVGPTAGPGGFVSSCISGVIVYHLLVKATVGYLADAFSPKRLTNDLQRLGFEPRSSACQAVKLCVLCLLTTPAPGLSRVFTVCECGVCLWCVFTVCVCGVYLWCVYVCVCVCVSAQWTFCGQVCNGHYKCV